MENDPVDDDQFAGDPGEGPRTCHLGAPGRSADEVSVAETLVGEALAARANAYAPYSGYEVGAALLADDGTVYRGCNVENASYPAGICAERTALVSAVAAGRRAFIAMAVAVAGPRPAPPCGICRQMLSEFAPQLRIIMATADGRRTESDLAALLPGAFGAADLGEGPQVS